MEKVNIIETKNIEKKVKIIVGQTDYSNETALEKLKEFNFDEPLKYTFTVPKTGRRK
jgi:hypothetical protein